MLGADLCLRRVDLWSASGKRLVLLGVNQDLERLLADDDLPAGWRASYVENSVNSEPVWGDIIVVDVCPDGIPRLDRVEAVCRGAPHAKVLAVTSYPSLALAVAVMKVGALTCLSKPVHLLELISLVESRDPTSSEARRQPSLERIEWEYVSRVLDSVGGNISRAARILRIQRSTLQRKLKRPRPAW